MNTLIQSLTKTAELLIKLAFFGAEKTYEGIKNISSEYLKALSITTLLGFSVVFLFISLKAFTGIAFFAYIAFFFMVVFTLILGLLGAPLGTIVGMMKHRTINPIEVGEKYIRFVGIVFFIELMVSLVIIRIPTHKNPEMIFPFFISALAVLVSSLIWGGLFSGRFYVFLSSAIMFATAVSFFIPETIKAASEKIEVIDISIAKAIREPHASIQKPDQIAPQARQTTRPAQQRQTPQRYSPPRAEKTQPVAQRNDEQARRQQIEKAVADSACKARDDSTKIALAKEKSPEAIKAKMDSARAAQESLCVALENQYKYR